MSQTSMTIATFKQVAVAMPPWISILLRANHGVGKSKVIKQVVAILRKKHIATMHIDVSKFKDVKDFFAAIDRRLSQLSEGDVIGLPSTDGQCTRFNPPDWFKNACDHPVALFLDELNRATPEVMQAAFQIILDRELNGWKLHPETRVYSAINNSAAYSVNEMDPALLDRFFVVDLNPTVEDFCLWARDPDPEQGGNLHWTIPDFIQSTHRSNGDSYLYAPKNASPGDVTSSPRAWEMLNGALVYADIIEKPNDPLFYPMCIGFVGVEAAIAFQAFCKSADNRITGKEIVNSYHDPKIRSKINRPGQGRQNEVVDKVSEYVIKEVTKLTDQQGQNIRSLMIDLPQEIRISLWSKLTAQGIDKIDLAKTIHKYCADQVLDVFGVPMGEAGIGIVPNIPGIFKPPVKGAPAKK